MSQKAWIHPSQEQAYLNGERIIVSTEKLALENKPVMVKNVEPYNNRQLVTAVKAK
ncbi:hypothetical protein [Halobacillus sp. BBL2006]|uniref:hypothetical protein n=1 Tax=Halobacillus sp. BBL2006 TaxID=1543706 RepID=UPI000B02F369|nr:hypothetical protein [Halobacillus sp. BBL2006]